MGQMLIGVLRRLVSDIAFILIWDSYATHFLCIVIYLEKTNRWHFIHRETNYNA